MKDTKKRLLSSIATLVVCFAMLIGSTYAWFTDSASTGVNKIQAGNLDIGLLKQDSSGAWISAEGKTLSWKTYDNRSQENILWEPGATYELEPVKVVNKGNLALEYRIDITGINGDAELNEVISWTMNIEENGNTSTIQVNSQNYSLLPLGSEAKITIAGQMEQSAGNEYQGKIIDGISITVYARQYTYENDSFDNQYDSTATYPVVLGLVSSTANTTISDASLDTLVDNRNGLEVTIPRNTLNTNDTINVSVERTSVNSNSVTYDIDLLVNGQRPDTSLSNPIKVKVEIGPDLESVSLTHNGQPMTKVDTPVNDQEYSYDKTTGVLTVLTKTFSPFEVAYTYASVCSLNGLQYANLNKAVLKAEQNDVIYLTDDISLDSNIVSKAQFKVNSGYDVTLDLQGYKITSEYEGISICNYGSLTINDSSEEKKGIIHNICPNNGNGNYSHDAVRNYGVLTINGGTFGDTDLDRTNSNTTHKGAAIRNMAGTECIINGGYFTAGDNYYQWGTGNSYTYAIRSSGNMIINDGTVYGAMNGGISADDGLIEINDGSFSLYGNNTFYVLATGNGQMIVNGGTFTRTGANRLIGGFEGMPSWDATEDLKGNGYTITGGTFVLNGQTINLSNQ